jgi:hypothetical protein
MKIVSLFNIVLASSVALFPVATAADVKLRGLHLEHPSESKDTTKPDEGDDVLGLPVETVEPPPPVIISPPVVEPEPAPPLVPLVPPPSLPSTPLEPAAPLAGSCSLVPECVALNLTGQCCPVRWKTDIDETNTAIH